MKLRRLLLLIAVLSLISGMLTHPVLGQSTTEPAGFKNVTLQVYPEYDDPRLLVMLEGKATGAEFPARVRFLVPAGAEMFSAGSKDAQGVYTGGPPARQSSSIEGWDEISYDLKYETFRVEYYSDDIKGLPDKTISPDFRFLYPIADLKVIVQQPTAATNFAVTPNGTSTSEAGFKVQTFTFSNLTPDSAKPLHFDITYTKSDLNPSIQNTTGNPPGNPVSNSGGGGVSAGLITLIIVVAVVVAVGGFWLGSRQSKRKPALVPSAGRGPAYNTQKSASASPKPANLSRPQTKNTPLAQPKKETPARESSRAKDFCDQCGSTVERNDKFCPSCGNKVD